LRTVEDVLAVRGRWRCVGHAHAAYHR
jgi:hypothetical protein